MHIKIVFKDLVDCNPVSGWNRPMVSLRIKGNEIRIPREIFKKRLDGYTVILKVKKYYQRGEVLEFETADEPPSPAKFTINADLVTAIHKL